MRSDPSTIQPRTSASARFVPLAAKLVLSTVAVLALASALIIHELSRREREHLVRAKRAAAERTADLFVAYDSVSLAFGDDEGVRDDVRTLGQSSEVTYAAVWSGASSEPIAEIGTRPERLAKPSARSAVSLYDEHVDVVRPIRGPEGEPLGLALVRMSLAREHAEFAVARRRIALLTALVAAVVAVIITVIVRITVVRPLGALASAAVRLQHGERAKVGLRANDEVGLLSAAFDTMTEAIVDRETRLVAMTERLQGVLDHIGQAIVVFGRRGTIESERSKQAVELVGGDEVCPTIQDVLYPEEGSTVVERSAFLHWLELVFTAPPGAWPELSELSPTEVMITQRGENRVYELRFRPLLAGGRVHRLMLLATDISDKRALIERVARQDVEHARRITAMQRLVAGGGHVFVRFLEAARHRVRTCLELLGAIEQGTDSERAAREELFLHVHTLRGEVRCFDLDAVEVELTAAELALSDLRTRRDERYDLAGACAGLAVRLHRVNTGLDAAQALFVAQSPVGELILDQVTVRRSDVERLIDATADAAPELRAVAERLSARPFGEVVFFVVEAAPRWLAREGKDALLVVEGRTVPVPVPLARALSSVLPHLVRNAIAHGVELPHERQASGKAAHALITLECVQGRRGPCVRVRDDGAGFDRKRLVSRAASLGVANASAGDAVELAFVHGLSTREASGDVAGHGVGLDAVRRELAAIGYVIVVESQSGLGTAVELQPASGALELGLVS